MSKRQDMPFLDVFQGNEPISPALSLFSTKLEFGESETIALSPEMGGIMSRKATLSVLDGLYGYYFTEK